MEAFPIKLVNQVLEKLNGGEIQDLSEAERTILRHEFGEDWISVLTIGTANEPATSD